MATGRTHFTCGELGDTLGVQAWRIARIFEVGIVDEPPRVGGRRLIPQALIPEIVDALRAKGWLGEPAKLRQEASRAD